ncbi:hypothetical protein RQP46_003873 [Phenoliferia psychrophenolica]
MDSGSSSGSRSPSPDAESGSGAGAGATGGSVKAKLSRVSRACIVCRVAKASQRMKCLGGLEPPCIRCRTHGTECVFTESRRGKSTKASRLAIKLAAEAQRERDLPELDLINSTNSSNQHASTINDGFSPPNANLPFHSAPISPPEMRNPATVPHNLQPAHPVGVVAEMSSFLASTMESSSDGQIADASHPPTSHSSEIGLANAAYFRGKGDESAWNTSEILGILDLEDIQALFAIFLDHLYVHLPILDKEYCTPLLVLQRSPALFNAICCVSVKYYTAKPQLLQPLREFATAELSRFPKERSLEYIQSQLAYLVWAAVPAASFEADMSWVRMGMIGRMALDLNMHRIGSVDMCDEPEWRIKSMRRTWMVYTVLEKTLCIQTGQPSLLHGVERAFEESPEDSLEDSRVFTQTEFLGLLEQSQKAIQRARGALFSGYAQLILASVFLQHSLDVDPSYTLFALGKYQTAALQVLHSFRDDFAAPGFSKYCSDFTFYHSVGPQFQESKLDINGVARLISTIADLLEEAAQTFDHLPFLFSKFVRRVLRARLPDHKEEVRKPLPDRLITPEEMATKELSMLGMLAVPAAGAEEDPWMQNNFGDTTIGRSELFSWDEFVNA